MRLVRPPGARTAAGRVALAALLCATLACARTSPDAPIRGTRHFVEGWPALEGDSLVHAVVEIPAGTSAKWEVAKESGLLAWELERDAPRIVRYLAYPANYGMIPRTLLPEEEGGDGDPLDVVVLGPALARGAVVLARPLGVLRLIDQGERDDKIIGVALDGPFASLHALDELQRRHPGVLEILEIWFSSYKGRGQIVSEGFADRDEALRRVRLAARAYEARAP